MWTEDPREYIEKMFDALSGIFVRTSIHYQVLEDPHIRAQRAKRLRGTLDGPPRACVVCQKQLAVKANGRWREYCGNSCRFKAYRQRKKTK